MCELRLSIGYLVDYAPFAVFIVNALIVGIPIYLSRMPIDRETFENASEDELEGLSVPDQVFGFLAANDDRAFKAQEIASQSGLNEGAVSTALSLG